MQKCIVDEVKEQPIGPYYGYQCDEVTDSSNWEQLGIILRYTVDNKPVERLLEFVQCDQITGDAICNNIVKSLTEAGLDIQFCRSQTMDGAGNMSGKQAGCAARFQLLSPKANYHYCSSHDLNLALCKCCDVKEIHVMLDALKQLGLFFKYSPKRSRRLEMAIATANTNLQDKIPKSKFHVFCETRWVEKHTTLRDFNQMYEPMLECLEAIGGLETGWDTKAVTEAHGLLMKITESNFIMCFQTVLHMFGYVTGLCSKLQGSSLDIVEAYDMVTNVREAVSDARGEDSTIVYEKASEMARKAGLEHLEMPRRCGRQTQRNNVPADSMCEYFERVIFYPFVDAFISQLDMRFNTMTRQACLALCLLPNNLEQLNEESIQSLVDHYNDDLPQPDTFTQELGLWKRKWCNTTVKPENIADTLSETCKLMYPNIFTILLLLSLTSVTSASVERSNSSLKFIKNSQRSTIGEDRFNALMLLYIHRDIKLDLDKIVDLYATKYPRRMLLLDPLSESK